PAGQRPLPSRRDAVENGAGITSAKLVSEADGQRLLRHPAALDLVAGRCPEGPVRGKAKAFQLGVERAAGMRAAGGQLLAEHPLLRGTTHGGPARVQGQGVEVAGGPAHLPAEGGRNGEPAAQRPQREDVLPPRQPGFREGGKRSSVGGDGQISYRRGV